jgi:hypothetical protein
VVPCSSADLTPGLYRIEVEATRRNVHANEWGDGREISTCDECQEDSGYSRFKIQRSAQEESENSYTIRVQDTNRLWYVDEEDTKYVTTLVQEDSGYTRFCIQRRSQGSYTIRVVATGNNLHADELGNKRISTRFQQDSSYTRFYMVAKQLYTPAPTPTPAPEGISTAQVKGTWKTTEFSGQEITFQVTYGSETTNSKAVTTEQARSVTASITLGISYVPPPTGGVSASAEVTVGGEWSESIAKQVESSLTKTVDTTYEVGCPDLSLSPTGQWFLWQWAMDQEDDGSGVGFRSATRHFICTGSGIQPPLCPLNYCNDVLCQTCIVPFEDLGATEPPTTAAPSETPAPVGIPSPSLSSSCFTGQLQWPTSLSS